MVDREVCCWTHCDNPQGIGTWTEINGETLPVCENHWYGNLDAERRNLRALLHEAASYGSSRYWNQRLRDEVMAALGWKEWEGR